MKDNIDYKKLWFELCEEKKQLQIENHRLNEDSRYWRVRFVDIEKMYSELKHKNWKMVK